MTDANYTHITVLLDESGSMDHLAGDTREGFNTFLKEQQTVGGRATMTVCKFSTHYNVLAKMQDIREVSPLNAGSYRPGGGTALLDAMGTSITELGAALAALPEDKRPGKVLFLVITDGEENASREWTKTTIAEMVTRQETEWKWNFLYLGANVDAFAESGDLGIRSSNAIAYTASSKGLERAYGVMSRSVGAVRGSDDQNAMYDVFCSAHVDDLQGVDLADRLKSTTSSSVSVAATPESTGSSKS